jgi:hypothetical protein
MENQEENFAEIQVEIEEYFKELQQRWKLD